MRFDELRDSARRLAQVNSLAAELAFFLALSLVPFLGVAIALISRSLPLDLGQSIEHVMRAVLPVEAHLDAAEIFTWARSSASEGWLTVGFAVALLTSLRFMSTCVRALGTVMSSDDKRTLHGWRSLLGALGLLLLWIIVLVVTALFLFIAPWVERGLAAMPDFADVSLSAFALLRATLVLALLYFVLRLTYRVVARPKPGRWRLSLTAALVAAGWIAISQLLSTVIPLLWQGTQLYGTLGSVVLFLTWAYVYAWLLLAGGLLLIQK
jgi:membrane protein